MSVSTTLAEPSRPDCPKRRITKRVAFSFRRFRNYRTRSLLYADRPNWDLLVTVTLR